MVNVFVVKVLRKGQNNTSYMVVDSSNQFYKVKLSNNTAINKGSTIPVYEDQLVAYNINNHDPLHVPLESLVKVLVGTSRVPVDSERHIDPIYPFEHLSTEQQHQLMDGSGHNNVDEELRRIHSSTALGVNYYKALEESVRSSKDMDFDVSFEWREVTPITDSPAPANIDVKYELDNSVYFVECKYLEPYYMRVEENKAAYCNPSRFPRAEYGDIWAELCQKVNNLVTNEIDRLNNFDAPQICRHLMAIHLHFLDHKQYYEGKKIIMQSMSWRMPDSFIDVAPKYGLDSNKLRIIRANIDMEISKLSAIINEAISNDRLGWNCRFEFAHYNDSLSLISSASKYRSFVEQYHL